MGKGISSPDRFNRFGAWEEKSPGTVYQAMTDGVVLAFTVDNEVLGYTDGSNPPTTLRAPNHDVNTTGGGITMPVRKNDYWKVVTEFNVAPDKVYWLPLNTVYV